MEVIAEAMHNRLYPKHHWAPGGPLAEAIVQLAITWKTRGLDVAIITTNYDNNLEEFAGDEQSKEIAEQSGITIEPFVELGKVSSAKIPVYHLNGYIPYEGKPAGNLAFSESGIAQGSEVLPGTQQPPLDWRSELLDVRLSSSTTVFVGTTLRDPTVVGSLIRTKTTGKPWRRYGLFAYQGDAWCDEAEDVRVAADAAFRARSAHLGVDAVRPDFFIQVGQLLNEVMYCEIVGGGSYGGDESKRYGQRLAQWWKDWSVVVQRGRPTNWYQDKCQELLAEAKADIVKQMKPGRDELIKLEIWMRREPHRVRELELWGTSEVASRNPNANHKCAIENGSRYAAVRAFCTGFITVGEITDSVSRWHSYVSVPIILNDPPRFRLPVGVSPSPLGPSAQRTIFARPCASVRCRRTLGVVGRGRQTR
jgi:hypothetical protein